MKTPNHLKGFQLASSVYFILLAELLLTTGTYGSGRSELYTSSDDVITLDSNTFRETVLESQDETVKVVQFYNRFCGHCQMFAPIYRELATHMRNWTLVVKIAAIDCSRDENLDTCSENKIDGYPSILIFPPHYRQNDSSENSPLSLRSLNIEWNVDDISDAILNYVHNLKPSGSNKIFAVDLLKGISYMITHEIRLEGDLNPNEFNTIRNLLTVIKKYLPLDKWDSNVNNLINSLRTKLDDNRLDFEKNGITRSEMKELLEKSGAETVRLRYSRENYMSCYESEKQNKGYTCSLWLLFHTLTAGEYFKAAPVKIRPTLVLTTMRDYITKFLGCTVCSSNFEKETANLEASLLYRNSSVIWLWDTHNRVRQRLNNEKQAAKSSLAGVIYPSSKLCPSCYITDVSRIGVDGATLDDIQWNKTEVFNRLVELYRPESIVTPAEMASLKPNSNAKVNYELIDPEAISSAGTDLNRSSGQWNIQSIFSASDMSICLILYLSCIVIVAIVCLSLNPKWKRFKTK